MATKKKTTTKKTTTKAKDTVNYNSNTGKKLSKGESFTDKATGKTYTQGQSFSASQYVADRSSSSGGGGSSSGGGSSGGSSSSNIVNYNTNTGQKLKAGESFTDKVTGQTFTQGQTFDSGAYVAAVNKAKGTSSAPQYNLGSANISRGSTDKNSVMELQKALNSSTGANLKVDGVFGSATEAAVRAYQQMNGLKVDGIVGTETKGALSGQGGGLSPANAVITDNANKEYLDALTPELRSIYDQVTTNLSMMVEQGNRINPDLTITPELTAKFLEDATKELDPYYQELIRQSKQDLSTSFQQLQQDYNNKIQREQSSFQNQLENQDIQEADAGMTFSSGRVKREQDLVINEQQYLDDLFQSNQRSVEEKAISGERKLGSRAFGDLGIPSLESYAAKRSINQPKGQLTSLGTRSLYKPTGDLFGELPGQAKTAIDTRAAALSEAEIKKRILNAGYGLGTTSLE